MARIRQKERNLAKTLFAASDNINTFGRSLVQPDISPYTVAQLRNLEDQLFGVLLEVRQHRHALTATPIEEKGQRA